MAKSPHGMTPLTGSSGAGTSFLTLVLRGNLRMSLKEAEADFVNPGPQSDYDPPIPQRALIQLGSGLMNVIYMPCVL